MADVQAQMRRLDAARDKVDKLKVRRTKTTALLEERTRRVEEIEAQARDEFECEVDELPAMVKQLKEEADQAIDQAEAILSKDEDKATPPEGDVDDVFG